MGLATTGISIGVGWVPNRVASRRWMTASTIANIWATGIDPDEGLVDGCCVGAKGSAALSGVSALRRPKRRRVDERAGGVIFKGALSNIRHPVPSTFSTYLHQSSDSKLMGSYVEKEMFPDMNSTVYSFRDLGSLICLVQIFGG